MILGEEFKGWETFEGKKNIKPIKRSIISAARALHSDVIGGNLFLNDDATIFHAYCSTIVPSQKSLCHSKQSFTSFFMIDENFSNMLDKENFVSNFDFGSGAQWSLVVSLMAICS